MGGGCRPVNAKWWPTPMRSTRSSWKENLDRLKPLTASLPNFENIAGSSRILFVYVKESALAHLIPGIKEFIRRIHQLAIER